MRLQKVNKQLADSRQDIDDMIRDHSIELQIAGLDDLQQSINESYDKYVKQLNSNLESITNAVSGATNQVVQSAGVVEQTISALLGSFGVNGLDKDSIRYTRQYGVLPESSVPPDVISLPNGNVLTPVTQATNTTAAATNKLTSAMANNSKVIDSFLNSYRSINGLDANYLKSQTEKKNLANLGTYQIGIDHMTYNFTISGVSDEEGVMRAISKNIDTIAKDVTAKIGRNVSQMGLKGTYYY